MTDKPPAEFPDTLRTMSLNDCETRCLGECSLRLFLLDHKEMAALSQGASHNVALSNAVQRNHDGLVGACRVYHDAALVSMHDEELS